MILTIFTPTYNRASYLNRVYESLVCQSNKNFEWLVVDDGSTDDTESIMEALVKENQINIKYIKKENGGKHTAHNLALEYAEGDYFVCLDSDDILTGDAIECICEKLHGVADGDCGLLFCKSDTKGTLLSNDISKLNGYHMGLYRMNKEYDISGEFAFVLKTRVARENLFPNIPGEKYIGECVLYDALEILGYSWYICKDVIEICEYQENGLSSRFYELLWNNPSGYTIYHSQRINLVISKKEKFHHAIRYNAFCKMARKKGTVVMKLHNIYTLLTWFPGQLAVTYYYKKIYKNRV